MSDLPWQETGTIREKVDLLMGTIDGATALPSDFQKGESAIFRHHVEKRQSVGERKGTRYVLT